MNLSSRRVRRSALAAMVLGGVLTLVVAVLIWQDTSGPAENENGVTIGSLDPYALDEVETKDTTAEIGAASNPVGAGPDDPFVESYGQNISRKVTLEASSDGQMYLGYLFRGDLGGVEFADGSFSISRTIVSPLPVALFAVQVMTGATTATCSIVVDGETLETETVTGAGQIAVCLG